MENILQPDLEGTSTEQNKIRKVFDCQLKNQYTNNLRNIHQREKRIYSIYKWILAHKDELTNTISSELKKSNSETLLNEIMIVLGEARNALKNLRKWSRPQSVDKSLALFTTSAKIIYEPKGVVLIISPWNFPLNLSIGPLISAIAAGNSVFLKPSEFTPLTNKIIKKMVSSLFTEEEVFLVEGDADFTEYLLNLPFHHIFFTGSTNVGKIVMTAAAKNLASVTLELGGKSPVYIGKNINLKTSAQKIVWGKFMNNGQACLAPDYLVVDSKIKKEMTTALIQSIEKMFGRSSIEIQNNPDYGSVINSHHFKRLKNLYDEAMEQGAVLEYGGIFEPTQNFIAPTILSNVSDKSKIYFEEIFGPILIITTYDDLHKTITLNQARPKPLTLYIFSNSKKEIQFIQENIPAGSTCVNDVLIQFFHPNLPMGGVNQSGFGNSHGYFGFKSFSHEKAFIKQARISFLALLYPPYSSPIKEKLIRIITRFL